MFIAFHKGYLPQPNTGSLDVDWHFFGDLVAIRSQHHTKQILFEYFASGPVLIPIEKYKMQVMPFV